MSEVYAVYDRDKNVEGPISPASFVPEYGSSVSFVYKNAYMMGGDNTAIKYVKGLNNTELELNLKFSNKTEAEAKSFLHLLEEVAASESGNLNFNNLSNSGVELAFPTGNIYKNLQDFLIKDYSFKLHNGLFDIDLSLQKNTQSYFLDWKGSSYLNTGNLQTGWVSGTSYEKFDIVYYPEYDTGSNPYSNKQVNRIEKFYYCNSGHEAVAENSPTGNSSAWSRSFFYDADDDVSITSDRSQDISSLENSFSLYNKKNNNQGLLKDIRLNLKNRSNKETRSIIHFIEKHENNTPFELNIPQLYTKKKFFVAKSMKHTFVYKDCNDIEIVVDEVLRYKKDFFLESFYHDN
jgi:hypothetical protein